MYSEDATKNEDKLNFVPIGLNLLHTSEVTKMDNFSPSRLSIQVRNMKMVFKFYGTWRWVTFEKLMMKIYDFF